MADRNLELALRISAKDTGASAAIRGIDRDVDALAGRLRQLAGVAAAAFGGRDILRAADEYATLSARVKLATESQSEFNIAQSSLFDISQNTRADLSATVALYSKVAGTLRNLGAEQKESLGFVESVNQALALSGTVGAQASGVILQLSQGLGAGAIRGDEFNSVMEGAPRLMQAFADGMGVPIGKLREMAEEGKLTAERLFKALASQRAKLAQEYAAFPETVAGAMQRIQNAFTRYIGDRNDQAGASRALALVLTGVANNFDKVGDAALVAGGIIASVYAGKVATAIAATTTATASNVSQFVAARQAAQALAIQEQASAAATLNQARAHEVTAAAALVEANAHRANIAELAIYGPVRAAAERQATMAATAHVAASQAVFQADARMAAASAAVAASQSRAALAGRALTGAMGLLGGPVGVVTTLLVAGSLAWLAWGNDAESAAQKARRATKEVGEQAKAILDRLKNEKAFGSGDIGVLRQQADILERQINVLNQSSGKSEGAAAKLAEKRAELGKVTAAITELEEREAEQAKKFRELAGEQETDAKQLAKAMRDSIEDRIKGYQDLVKSTREAWQQSLQAEKDYLDDAKRLRAQANARPVDTSTPQGQAEANLALLAERAKLERLVSTQGTSYDDIKAQAEAVRDLVNATQEGARAKELLRETDLAQARGAEAAAQAQKTQSEGLRQEWDKAVQVVKDLEAALERVGKKTAINIESDQAKIILADITARLDALKDKTITVTVVPVGTGGKPLDNIPIPVPGKAAGGQILGPGHDTSDNILLLGSPGEYMLRAAAVRYYGLPLIEAINGLRLPRFANGGVLSRARPILSMPASKAAAAQPERTVNVILDLGALGRYPMRASPSVADELAQEIRRAAMKIGMR